MNLSQLDCLNFIFLSPPSSSSSLTKFSPQLSHRIFHPATILPLLLFQMLHLLATHGHQTLLSRRPFHYSRLIPFLQIMKSSMSYSRLKLTKCSRSHLGHLLAPMQSHSRVIPEFKRASKGIYRRPKEERKHSTSCSDILNIRQLIPGPFRPPCPPFLLSAFS